MIPLYHLQSQTLVPQFSFICRPTSDKRLRIRTRRAVHLDLIPGHEHLAVHVATLFRSLPHGMEIIGNPVGRAFKNNHRQLHRRNAAAHTSDKVGWSHPLRVFPECHLAQMGHREIKTAHGILSETGGYRHFAAASGDLACVGRFLPGCEFRRFIAEPERIRIFSKHVGVHSADSGCRILHMSTDQGVPVAALRALDPREIHLHQRRAAPLTRFQHYESQRTTGKTFRLEFPHHPSLGRVQPECYALSGLFVAYLHTLYSPVFKVMAHTQAFVLYCRFQPFVFRVSEQRPGQ